MDRTLDRTYALRYLCPIESRKSNIFIGTYINLELYGRMGYDIYEIRAVT